MLSGFMSDMSGKTSKKELLMDPRQLFIDDRLLGGCVYCGGVSNTRDHVPSKVFLDDPLPDDLPVVEACMNCNQGFSLDEEYLACFLEAVITGTADPEKLIRTKIKRALSRNAQLVSRIQASAQLDDSGNIIWTPEMERVRNVVLKLARGHTAYELGLPQIDEPVAIMFQPFIAMSEQDRAAFENAGSGELREWPEIGSRAFLRACGSKPFADSSGPWIEIQPMRYRYAVDQIGGVLVRMVLYEYLACQVEWE
jgi:hypothetical protein